MVKNPLLANASYHLLAFTSEPKVLLLGLLLLFMSFCPLLLQLQNYEIIVYALMMVMGWRGRLADLPKYTTVDTDCQPASRDIYYDLSADNTCAWLNFDLVSQ